MYHCVTLDYHTSKIKSNINEVFNRMIKPKVNLGPSVSDTPSLSREGAVHQAWAAGVVPECGGKAVSAWKALLSSSSLYSDQSSHWGVRVGRVGRQENRVLKQLRLKK